MIYENETEARAARPRAFLSVCTRWGRAGYVSRRAPRADGTTLVTKGWWAGRETGGGQVTATWIEPWSFEEGRCALVARTQPAIDAFEAFRGRSVPDAVYRAARDACDAALELRQRARLGSDGQAWGWPDRCSTAEMTALALALSSAPSAAEMARLALGPEAESWALSLGHSWPQARAE